MIIVIDPSLNCTGYAVFDGPRLVRSGVVKSSGENESVKLESICRGIEEILGDKQIDKIAEAVVEVPGKITYRRSQDQSTGKPLNQDSMHKLCFAIGAILLTLRQWGIECKTVKAHEWKGSMNKATTLMIARS